MEIKCRLCSSGSALISVFSGKCRKNRDYIRKLVEITTGIKFEKNDTFKCICYPCTVQVYNFYIFKARSIENENILEAHTKKNEGLKLNKMEILGLDNIILPGIDDIKNILEPWLMSKSKYFETTTNENGESADVENTPGRNKVFNSECRTVENGTQCDTIKKCDESTQCLVPDTAVHSTQTHTIKTKSNEIQCNLASDNFKKPKWSNMDSFTQTELEMADKAVQYVNSCEEKESKSQLSQLMDIKREVQPLNYLQLSPVNRLNISRPFSKSALSSPVHNFSSPASTKLLEANDSSRAVALCQECEQIFYTKSGYQMHRKTHMVCKFCKKKFTSLKRTTWHVANECKIVIMMRRKPEVKLVRLERMQQVRCLYPQCLEDLKDWPRAEESKARPIVRLRSRSTCSTDSFHSYCSMCKNSWNLLNSLTLGIDKSVQTNLPLFVGETVTLKSKRKANENSALPREKAKLSPHSFNK